jgi:hypothetical protein
MALWAMRWMRNGRMHDVNILAGRLALLRCRCFSKTTVEDLTVALQKARDDVCHSPWPSHDDSACLSPDQPHSI